MSFWLIKPDQDTTIFDFIPEVETECISKMIDAKTFLVKSDQRPKNDNTSEITESKAVGMGWQ